MNARRLSALLVLAALAGCASAPPAEAPRPRALGGYAADPFVPVNLYLNANEQADPSQAALIEHAAEQLRASGAFVRVDRGVQRWPITIQARYRCQRGASGGDVARRILGALTLGLAPVRVSQTHTLGAEIFEEPDRIAELEFSVQARNRVSLYDLADPLRDERAAVDALLERLLAEIAQRRLIPRWREFKPDPPRKKKPKIEGRPT